MAEQLELSTEKGFTVV